MLSNSSSWFEIEQESLEMYSERLGGELENDIKAQKKDYKIKMFAIFLFIWSAVSGSLMVLTCKLGYNYNPHLNAFDYMFVRSGAMIISASIPLLWNKVSINVRKENRLSLFLLNVISLTSMLANFIGLKYLPAIKASLIFNLYPIFMSIMGIIFLNEIIKRMEIMWMIGAFIGVIIMMINKSSGSSIESSYSIQIISSFLVLYWWIMYAIACLYIRVFNQIHSPLLAPFYYALTLSSFSAVFFFVYPSAYNSEFYTYSDITLFIMSGVFNILINIFSGYAFKFEKVNSLAPFAYIGNILSLINDVFVFNYSLGFTDILGVFIVIFCLLLKLKAA